MTDFKTITKVMPVFWLVPLIIMAMHPERHPGVATLGFGFGSGLSAGLLISSIFAEGNIGKLPARALLGTAGILVNLFTTAACF